MFLVMSTTDTYVKCLKLKSVLLRLTYLRAGGELLEDLVDLVLEPSTQHLICLVQHKHLDVLGGWMEGRRSDATRTN